MKIKTIRIYPSVWTLDVILSSKKKEYEIISQKRYGLVNDNINFNECNSIDTGKDCELKGRRIIVVSFKNLKDKSTIVHELIHVLWHASQYIGYSMTYDSQEWQALLFEYLYKEVLDKNGYKDYEHIII